MGLTHDRARRKTEKAAGFGMGLSWYHDRFTLSGTLGMPLVEGDRLDVGDPVLQLRLDAKAW
jgi:hemolysin activation/secretion protein